MVFQLSLEWSDFLRKHLTGISGMKGEQIVEAGDDRVS